MIPAETVRKQYVVGFLIDQERREVALVRKNRPTEQAGRLNGLGGKIEFGEEPAEAMAREFEEEGGVRISEWEQYAMLKSGDSTIHFFRAFAPRSLDGIVKTMTDEEVLVVPISSVTAHNAVPNVMWLVPMAMAYDFDKAGLFVIEEHPGV